MDPQAFGRDILAILRAFVCTKIAVLGCMGAQRPGSRIYCAITFRAKKSVWLGAKILCPAIFKVFFDAKIAVITTSGSLGFGVDTAHLRSLDDVIVGRAQKGLLHHLEINAIR